MSSLFIEILNMSISAGCVTVIVVLIRLLMKKAPKKYAYALWAVVFFRLVCPFTIQMPVSAVPVQPHTIPQDIVYSKNPLIRSGLPAVDSVVNDIISAAQLSEPASKNIGLPSSELTVSVNPIQIALEIGTVVWLTGTVALLLYAIISYLRLKRKVGTAIWVNDNIYETDLIKTPFVLGYIRPKIYIPIGLESQELQCIIWHEQTHIRRHDYLIKPFAFLVTAIHWFNPFAWVSYVLMARDMELSADEYVVKHSDTDIRSVYSNSLLNLSAKKSGLFSPLAFGETGVKVRIKNVLNYRNPAFWISAITAVAVIASSVLLLGGRAVSVVESEAESPWDWAAKLGFESLDTAEIWTLGDTGYDTDNAQYTLSTDERLELVSLIGALKKENFTQNSNNAGGTPVCGITLYVDTQQYNLTQSIGPGGSLELGYNENLWWIDSDELLAFVLLMRERAMDTPIQHTDKAEVDTDGNISIWKDGREIKITPEMCSEISVGFKPPLSSAYYGFSLDMNGYIVATSLPATGTVWHWIFLTHDEGETWKEVGNANDIYAHPITCAGMSGDGNIILGFYSGWDGLAANILVSEDNGATWKEPEFVGAERLGVMLNGMVPVSLDFDGNYGELLYDMRDSNSGENSGQALFVTYDGGLNWALA